MRKIKTIFLLLIVVFAFSNCSYHKQNERLSVAVTIMPLKYLAEKIVGDSIDVVCAIPQGSNPEEYDANIRQIKSISNSKLYFKVGNLGFEKNTLPSIIANAPDIKLIDVSEGIVPIKHQCSHACEVEAHFDPHCWSSPKSAKVVANNIFNAVANLDSENISFYSDNHKRLIAELDSIDRVVSNILYSSRGSSFAIFHPSLSYFARDYGLNQIALENEGKEMTTKTMQESLKKSLMNDVDIVFIQNEFNTDNIETFANEINARVATINPLSYNIMDEVIYIANEIAK